MKTPILLFPSILLEELPIIILFFLGKQVEMGFSLKGQTEKMAFRKRFAAALADVNLPDARKILGSYPHE